MRLDLGVRVGRLALLEATSRGKSENMLVDVTSDIAHVTFCSHFLRLFGICASLCMMAQGFVRTLVTRYHINYACIALLTLLLECLRHLLAFVVALSIFLFFIFSNWDITSPFNTIYI